MRRAVSKALNTRNWSSLTANNIFSTLRSDQSIRTTTTSLATSSTITMEQCTPAPSTGEGQKITLTLPDDFHHHFRQGDRVKTVLSHAVHRFGKCIAMPNLKPPVTTVETAAEYRQHIIKSLPSEEESVVGSKLAKEFNPLMTLYLTDNTKPEEIYKAKESGFVHAVVAS